MQYITVDDPWPGTSALTADRTPQPEILDDNPPSRILIVDDDASVRRALADVLTGEGYEVVPAGGGLQALALAGCVQVDLLLLDINLLGQSGWDTFAEFDATHPDTPIILITARPGQTAQATQWRADALMEKPLNLPLLLETIARLLEEPRGERRRRRADPGFQTCHLTVKARHGMTDPNGTAPDTGARPTASGRAPGPRATHVPGQKQLLVVDDDPSVREMLGRVLVSEGYVVREAADGATAIAMAGDAQCDLVLLDLGLPGTSGWDTLARLTATSPGIPIIIITGRSHQVLNALAAGVQALIQKPLDFPRLLQTIQVLLGESPPTCIAQSVEQRAERLDC